MTGTKGTQAGTLAPAAINATQVQTATYPVSKLVMQNMKVLRVERDKPRQTSSTTDQQNNQPAVKEVDDVKRLYVKVDRDQLEVLSFVLNTGVRNIAVRADKGSTESLPTDGVTWDDFAKRFFAQRGTDPNALNMPLSYLHHFHLMPKQLMVRARPELYVDMNRQPLDATPLREGLKAAYTDFLSGQTRRGDV